ncbi:class I adenylate-forming enzyme family protein [Halobacterium wangiae]|uniref:class I adenylate-forming enzyme family protein n=1 Tax=Halobacterium wangiae TaxID=2902623 RepID=UPI001E4D4781|nr:class I adenylate-forming enzyme family protein [Halobacterium wangiae]
MHDESAWARNLGTLHDDRAAIAPDSTALVVPESEETVTYGELADAIARAGNAVRELGVERGDRVALCFENGPELVAVFFGAMRAGFVPVPVNVRSSVETVRHVVADSGSRVVVAGRDDNARSVAADAASECESVAVLGTYGGSEGVDGVRTVDFEARVDEVSPTLDPVEVAFDDPALQPYSSGSTGVPKGIVLSHGGAYWNARRFAQVNLMDEQDVTLTATPLYHKNAMLNLKTTLLGGGTVVVMRSFDAAAAIAAIDAHDVTYLTGVPAIYHYLVEAEDALEVHDVSSVEVGSTGSDAVSGSLYDEFESVFGAPLTEGYGLTEGGPMITMTPRWGPKRHGSAGIPLPEVDARVVDPETGEELPPGESGELLVASPGVARYHDLPEVSAERFEERDGKRFLHTGDVMWRDEDDYHYVVGRLDDMLIVGGENIYPVTVEERLERHEAVSEAVVVPVPHRVKGEVPVAFVVPDGEVTEAELKQFAIEHGPAAAHPRHVFFVEEYPLTGTEKVARARLQARAEDRLGTLPEDTRDD